MIVGARYFGRSNPAATKRRRVDCRRKSDRFDKCVSRAFFSVSGTGAAAAPRGSCLRSFAESCGIGHAKWLCLYTVPIHEFRHHGDLVLTPAGAQFYLGLAAEHSNFSSYLPFSCSNRASFRPERSRISTLG